MLSITKMPQKSTTGGSFDKKAFFQELLLNLSVKNALCTLFKVFFTLYYVTKKCSFSQTYSLLKSKLENLRDELKIYFFTFSCFSLKVVIRVYF